MSGWQGFSPIEPVCVDCGARLDEWTGPLDLDWRDDGERRRGGNALAIQAHRHDVHRVEPAVGDLVRYAMPWRGYVLVSEVYRVDQVRPNDDHRAFARRMRGDDLAPLIGTSYTLTNPRRSDDRCFPFFGDPDHPYTFEMVEHAPPVELDLMDLLDWTGEAA